MRVPTAHLDLLVVTDLDGTLLDDDTYGCDAAHDALAALRRRSARLVLATSKTAAEVQPFAATLDLPIACIIENGGAVTIPRGFVGMPGAADLLIEPGTDRQVLIRELEAIARETRSVVRGFADLSPADVSGLTGLSLDAARLALERRFDEPFIVADEDAVPRIEAAAEHRGLIVTRGGRFHHLTGRTDKGCGLRHILEALATHGLHPYTIGLGDSPNDLPFLRLVDEPVIVPRPRHQYSSPLVRALPGATRAPAAGPAGWNAAILTFLSEEVLSREHST